MNNRVLSYNLSKEISSDELVKVTGGKAVEGYMSATPTAGGSIDMHGNTDASIDYHWDF